VGNARALAGFAGAALVTTGWALCGIAAARRWAGDLPAPLHQVTAAVLGLAGLLLSAALLGTVGQLAGWPLVAVAILVGALGAAALRRPRRRAAQPGGGTASRSHKALLGAAGGLVAVRWVAELLQTLDRGFSHADELHYHLTHSALFVQSGRTWPIHFTSVGDGSAYHPAHSELLHALGMAVVGSDFLSIFLNLGFAVLALAAGWAIGRHAGNPGAGALVVAASLSLPLVVAESGSALNDTMAIALLLAAAALLLEACRRDGDRRIAALAGVAAGLAVGTKLTVVVAVGGLLVLVAVAGRSAGRWARTSAFAGAAVVAGGYWYLRNLAHTGNPVPALSFGPLPGPDLELQRAVEFPVLDYLTDLDVWRTWFVPGLEFFAGPLWPLLVGLALAGGLAALCTWRTDRPWALLGGVGLLSLAGYAATPTSAAGAPGVPALFQFNLRYAVPGALLCVLAGLAHPALRRRPGLATALAGSAVVAANLHDIDPRRGVLAVTGIAVLTGVAWVATRLPRDHASSAGAAVLAAAVVLIAGVGLQERYLDRRWTADLPRWPAYQAGDRASGVAVGLTGFPQSYPFYGADLDNRVVVLGEVDGHELRPHRWCDAWWGSVEAADLDVVVVLSEPRLAESELGRSLIRDPERWLRDAGAAPLLQSPAATVFDVRGTSGECGGAPVTEPADP
jgi:4-amino-4-deoxy-L-arabinose transferase-like glycosyltransferase